MNEVRHIWTLISEKSIVDKDTNNLTLVNLLERFTITVPESEKIAAETSGSRGFQFPISYVVTTLYKRVVFGSDITFSHKITFHNPKGEQLGEKVNKILIEKDIINFRYRNGMSQLLVENPGEYSIKTWVKGEGENEYTLCGSIPLEIKLEIERTPKIARKKVSRSKSSSKKLNIK